MRKEAVGGGEGRHLKKQKQCRVSVQMREEQLPGSECVPGRLPGGSNVQRRPARLNGSGQMKACGGRSPYKGRVVPKLGANSNH